MKLPKFFPPGTLFGDAENVPVTCEPGRICLAWNGSVPRFFPLSSFDRASLMHEAEFRRWVDDGQGSPYAPGAPAPPKNRAADPVA